MSFTGQLGTPSSQLGGLVLGYGPEGTVIVDLPTLLTIDAQITTLTLDGPVTTLTLDGPVTTLTLDEG